MKTLHIMLLKSFLPILLISLLFFVLTLEMVDVFANLWRYLNNDASIKEILQVSLLYLPTSISYALPPALLFAVSFSLGNLYARNELIAILGAGISYVKLIMPLFVIGLLLSFGYFFFHEALVIETFASKNQLSRELLGQKVSYSNTDITVIGETSNNVYHADYYNDSAKTLSGLTVLQRGANSHFKGRIEAGWAEFVPDNKGEGKWVLHEVNEYTSAEDAELVHNTHRRLDAPF